MSLMCMINKPLWGTGEPVILDSILYVLMGLIVMFYRSIYGSALVNKRRLVLYYNVHMVTSRIGGDWLLTGFPSGYKPIPTGVILSYEAYEEKRDRMSTTTLPHLFGEGVGGLNGPLPEEITITSLAGLFPITSTHSILITIHLQSQKLRCR